jgi:hypothetical protein
MNGCPVRKEVVTPELCAYFAVRGMLIFMNDLLMYGWCEVIMKALCHTMLENLHQEMI